VFVNRKYKIITNLLRIFKRCPVLRLSLIFWITDRGEDTQKKASALKAALKASSREMEEAFMAAYLSSTRSRQARYSWARRFSRLQFFAQKWRAWWEYIKKQAGDGEKPSYSRLIEIFSRKIEEFLPRIFPGGGRRGNCRFCMEVLVMCNYYNLKEIIAWLLDSKKPATAILTLLVEIVMEMINENFVIQDPGRVKNLIKADLSALLYEIAIEKRKTATFAFFRNRIKRVTLNLYQSGLLANKINFSEIEDVNTENNEFLNFYLEKHSQLPEYVIIRPKKGRNGNEGMGDKKRQGLKKKTLERFRILNEIDEFYPGCLEIEEEVRVQKTLFDFVKEQKIVKERVKVKKAA